jgi:hypothetical protein
MSLKHVAPSLVRRVAQRFTQCVGHRDTSPLLRHPTQPATAPSSAGSAVALRSRSNTTSPAAMPSFTIVLALPYAQGCVLGRYAE